MKKSFFLLTAALVAMFSFSACSSNDKDDNESTPGPSSGSNADPSSGSTGNSETVQFACDMQHPELGSVTCYEIFSSLSSAELSEVTADCLEEDEDGDAGIVVNKCPDGAALECPYEEDGERGNVYLYGLAAIMFGGVCPDPSDFE